MVIHDEKDDHHESVERISHERRFEGPVAHRVKWIVEFSYSVDSKQNPMIQISDLVTYCTRKFLEIENGYRDDWSDEAKMFYAECFRKIDDRVKRKGIVERGGTSFRSLNEHLERIRASPRRTWRSHWFGS